jgi:undecaprenyl diphosphate synthase
MSIAGYLPKGTVVPDHVAIIPDGNRRWARARGWHTFKGHKQGFDRVPELVRVGREMGIHTMTLWAFSTENWNRTKEEIGYLMKMYEEMVEKNLREAHKYEARIIHLGRKDRIPASLLKKVVKAEGETRGYKKHVLNIALDYGGHDEIIRAVGRIISESRIQNPEFRIDQEVGKYRGEYAIYKFAEYLDTREQPYPYVDLVIRTSGEQRTSGLLSWQTAYAEYYFLAEHFPDFTKEKLEEAVMEFSRRRRRFGGGDAAKHLKFNPERAGKWEKEWWKGRKEGDGFNYLVKLTEEVYGLGNGVAMTGAEQILKGWEETGRGEWLRAVNKLEEYFRLLQEETGFAYDAKRAAELEVGWWKCEEGRLEEMEGALREAVAEQFRINGLQAAKAARLRALAWLAGGEGDWQGCEEYLVRGYRVLKEMVA